MLDGGTPAVAISGDTNPYGGGRTSTTSLPPAVLEPDHQPRFQVLMPGGSHYITKSQLGYTHFTLIGRWPALRRTQEFI